MGKEGGHTLRGMCAGLANHHAFPHIIQVAALGYNTHINTCEYIEIENKPKYARALCELPWTRKVAKDEKTKPEKVTRLGASHMGYNVELQRWGGGGGGGKEEGKRRVEESLQ